MRRERLFRGQIVSALAASIALTGCVKATHPMESQPSLSRRDLSSQPDTRGESRSETTVEAKETPTPSASVEIDPFEENHGPTPIVTSTPVASSNPSSFQHELPEPGTKAFSALSEAAQAEAGSVPSAGQANVPDGPLSLEDVLRLASASNRRISIADRRALIERDRELEALALVLPRVNGEVRYSMRSNDQGFDTGDDRFVTGSRQLGTASVSLLVPIYDFGDAFNQMKAQRAQTRISRLDAVRERQDVALAVTQAYFRILEAAKLKAVVDDSIATLEQQLRISRDYFDQGLVAKNDLLVAEVQLAKRQQERITAENGIQLATATLNRLAGLPVDRPTTVVDVLEMKPWTGPFESLVETAVQKRPDLLALGEQVYIAKALYRAVRTSFYPRIFGFGSFNYTDDDSTLNQTYFSGGFGVNIRLLDASIISRIRQQRRQVDQAADIRQDEIDEAVLEIQRAYLSVQEASRRIPVAQQSIDQAEENLRITRDRYREGLVTSADVLIEEERFAQARADYYRALYDYHQAFAQMVHTIGGPPPASTGASIGSNAPEISEASTPTRLDTIVENSAPLRSARAGQESNP